MVAFRLIFVCVMAALFMPTTSSFSISPSFLATRTQMMELQMSSQETDGTTVRRGVVKWFNTIKGFGFIQPDDGGSDVFVHQTAIETEGFRSLADGERVEFRSELDERGRLRAMGVTGPGGSNVQGAPFRPPPKNYERY